jgi:hypothetical protein
MALLSENGQLREVPAAWSAEGDAISVGANGSVVARHPGPAIVHARYRDHSGQATVHVVMSVAGTWRGSITVLDCWPEPSAPADVCQGRVGLVAPLVLDVTQRPAADNYDNLRATVQVFVPPAAGRFIGAFDSTGLLFLDGTVERPGDGLAAALRLRWNLDKERLVPFAMSDHADDVIDVQFSVRAPAAALIREQWRLSTMSR